MMDVHRYHGIIWLIEPTCIRAMPYAREHIATTAREHVSTKQTRRLTDAQTDTNTETQSPRHTKAQAHTHTKARSQTQIHKHANKHSACANTCTRAQAQTDVLSWTGENLDPALCTAHDMFLNWALMPRAAPPTRARFHKFRPLLGLSRPRGCKSRFKAGFTLCEASAPVRAWERESGVFFPFGEVLGHCLGGTVV